MYLMTGQWGHMSQARLEIQKSTKRNWTFCLGSTGLEGTGPNQPVALSRSHLMKDAYCIAHSMSNRPLNEPSGALILSLSPSDVTCRKHDIILPFSNQIHFDLFFFFLS